MKILAYLKSLVRPQRVAGAMIFLCGLSAGTLFGSSLTVGTDNGSNAFPFGGPFTGYTGTQYQEAYASSNFSAPILITGIDFFLASGFTGNVYAGTYTLSLSVISSDIGTLSSTDLNSNIGSDNTVYENVALSGAAPGKLTFTGTPFLYDPTAGNLLLNISVAGGVSSSKVVAFQDNEGIGTNVARYQNFGTNSGYGWGLVTEFDSSSSIPAVPEPGMLSLLCCGLAAVVARRYRRR